MMVLQVGLRLINKKYGKYFYCYTKGLRGFTFYQDVKVHKGGWYLLRCNGFSTANSSENITTNGKTLANLFITVLGADGKPNEKIYSAATLDGISQGDAYQLAKTHNGKAYEGAGIGHAFFEGEYENQRCRYVSTKPRMGKKYQTRILLRSA